MRHDDTAVHDIASSSKKARTSPPANSSLLRYFKTQVNADLLELVHDAIIVCDDSQHILLWNKSAEQLYKWTQQEAVGQIYHELLRSQLPNEAEENLQSHFMLDHWEGTLWQVRRDGVSITIKSKQTISRSMDNQHSITLIANQIAPDFQHIDHEKNIQLHLMKIAREIGLWSWDLANDQILMSLDTTNNKHEHNEFYTYAQFIQMINPEDRVNMNKAVQIALKTKKDYSVEYRRQMRTDHIEHWIKVTGRVIHDEQGRPTYIIGVATDVTAQRNLAQKLKEANHHLQVVLETIDDSFFFLDNDWHITYASQKTEELTLLPQKSLLGKNFWEKLSYLQGSFIEQKVHEAVETQKTLQFENLSIRNGRWYDFRLYPSSEGTIIYCHDITEHKDAKRALLDSEAKFSWLFDTDTISVIIGDADGTVYKANDAFLRMLGFTRNDLNTGVINWRHQTTPEYTETDLYYFERMTKSTIFEPYEKEFFDKQGKRIPVMIAGAFVEANSTMATVLILDMSAQKQLEKQKETFLSIVGHELRTPLTAINGSIQLAQRRIQRFIQAQQKNIEPETDNLIIKLDKLLEQSLRQTRVQNRLINDLLDISRLAIDKLELNMQPHDLIHIVEETIEDLRYTAGEHEISLKLPLQPTISVLADSDRIGQVISNYVTNALKYSDYHECVTVEVTLDANEVRVWVHDKGPGLSKEDQTRIWESYYRTNNAKDRQGSGINLGLGLHICQILIQRHKGQVGVESAEKVGSSFWFSLPISHC